MNYQKQSKSSDLYNTSYFHRITPHVLAGGTIAGIIDIIFFPLETIKTRLQTSSNFLKVPIYKNLFKGLSPQLTISFPSYAGYFFGYESTKYIFEKKQIPNDFNLLQRSILGGVAAEICHSMICNPFEIIKQQIQVGQQDRMIESLRYIFNKEGIRGFYRGFWSLLGREVPYSCIQMPVYEVTLS